ncbi:type VI secretion protein IcmF/TssM N-terminal domain-containing protein [Chondromyces apiculatus]|uniref:Type VI secretion system component TssM1 N-terminal domain-containing protein n=1 Tax=Chondromyces apiculatus DSM 436 TaxID=1192034 RepID=A0A017T6Z2_9BACT|nr:type VI secretion protein IcmF/TssM N-terminal domain-containing protein [Chondromyces apiculatus]EYF05023.1 Hypothetical protein CAP_3613 [Chondromyces apiculatus DSM 436]
MKPLDDAQHKVESLTAEIDPRLTAAGIILVPILAVAAVALYKRYNTQKAAKKAAQAPPPAALAALASGEAQGSQVGPFQLRLAWRRFLGRLPPQYRRSILNFEHFVVLGAAASGKSTVIDAYSDWRRQAKQALPSQPDDKDLPVYLGSNAVMMEIPAKVLHDEGAAVGAALKHLWRPLYTRRSPTIIVVVDARRLLGDTHGDIEDLADTLRGKINLLSGIRKRALEVRVILTHLDAMEGYTDFASFCRDQGIPLRVGLAGNEDLGAHLDAWLEGLGQHLPRALTLLDAHAYRRLIAFLRAAPPLLPPLRHLLTSLFVDEPLSPTPVRGGLFLASAPPSPPNPLRRASARGPGPDPRLRHLVGTALVASGVMTFLAISFTHQHGLWKAADGALRRYKPATADIANERVLRASITTFTEHHASWLDTHPDFFEAPRERMRTVFSEAIRSELLLPGLRKVAELGRMSEDQLKLPYQRSLYFLALIHSDRFDDLGIIRSSEAQNNLDAWVSMTSLDPELIVDYLENTDQRLRTPVSFQIDGASLNKLDGEGPWREFFGAVQEAMRAHVVEPVALEAMQRRARELERDLDRLRYARLTLGILEELDRHDADAGARGGGNDRGEPEEKRAQYVSLTRAYDRQFGTFLQKYEAFRALDVEELKGILKAVGGVDLAVVEDRGLLVELVSSLESLYAKRPREEDPWIIVLRGEGLVFEEHEWIAVIRDSKASLLIGAFIRYDALRSSIFFRATGDEPQPVAWNPAGDGASVFQGRSVIQGRYTRAAYDARVRGPVLRLRDLLDDLDASKQPSKIDAQEVKVDQQKAKDRKQDADQLVDFVRSQVERYAAEYHQQTAGFVQGFALVTPSDEALRVALALMSDKGGGTTFDDFLRIVDGNVNLNVLDPSTRGDEPMLAPMKKLADQFGRWHEVVDGGAAAPKVTQYKAILDQMLKDLGASQAAAPAEAPKEAASPAAATGGGGGGKTDETLEQALAPSGRLALANLRGDAGAYAALIRDWIKGTGLPQEQQGPFLAPLARVSSIGQRDIEGVVGRVFRRDLLPDLERVVTKFPFDPAATEEVSPEELTALFHPKDGRVYDVFRRYLEPVSQVDGSHGFALRPSLQARLTMPEGMYRILNAAGVISARLWDEKGKPRPLSYQLSTVPLGSAPRDGDALTLVYVKVGSESLFNFNQKPTEKVLAVDWTTPSTALVGVQLTDVASKETSFPPPLAVEGAHFSLLRLLRKAQQPPATLKQAAPAQLYTWEIRPISSSPVQAQVVVAGNPWETFTIGKAVAAARSQ